MYCIQLRGYIYIFNIQKIEQKSTTPLREAFLQVIEKHFKRLNVLNYVTYMYI